MERFVKQGNFAWLILALLVVLIGIPIADDCGAVGSPIVKALAFSALLGVGVLSLRNAGLLFKVAMTIAVLGILLNIAASQTTTVAYVYASSAAVMIFLIIAIAYTFKQIAVDSTISTNRIIGAIAVYLLLGVLWSVAYTIVELLWPGSFRGFESGTGATWASDWLYFSFVTMTTLGYGDIAPVSATARMLAYMQAIFGQLYIAILVAGLVGAYIAREK